MIPRRLLVVLFLPFLLAVLACGPQGKPAEPSLPEVPSVVEPVPESPTTADEGKPGVYERLPGVDPPVRDFLVEPEGDGPVPGIVLAHGWWGLDPGTRELARDLAAGGYLVVVPDLFEQVVATSRTSATELLAGVDAERARELLGAGVDRLAAHPRFDGRFFLLGVKAGGDFALPFAAARAEAGEAPAPRGLVLDSTNLGLHLDALPRVRCPVLWLVGAGSAAFGADREREWKDVARRGGVELTVALVPGAGTGLLDPRSLGYREEAYREALDRIFDWMKGR